MCLSTVCTVLLLMRPNQTDIFFTEDYLKARAETAKFDRNNFDCLSNKFLAKLVTLVASDGDAPPVTHRSSTFWVPMYGLLTHINFYENYVHVAMTCISSLVQFSHTYLCIAVLLFALQLFTTPFTTRRTLSLYDQSRDHMNLFSSFLLLLWLELFPLNLLLLTLQIWPGATLART
jgi:hypothetical protein